MKGNRLLILKDGEETIRIFDAGQIDIKEIDYDSNGEKLQKFDYAVTDSNTDGFQIFRVSIKTSGKIDALLAEDTVSSKRRREGSGKTRYHVTPVRES